MWGHVRTGTLESLVSLSPAAVLDASPLLGSGPSLVSGPCLGASPPFSQLGPCPKRKVNAMLESVYIKALNMMRDVLFGGFGDGGAHDGESKSEDNSENGRETHRDEDRLANMDVGQYTVRERRKVNTKASR